MSIECTGCDNLQEEINDLEEQVDILTRKRDELEGRIAVLGSRITNSRDDIENTIQRILHTD